MDDIKEAVVTILQQYLDNKKERDNTNKYHLQGQSARSKDWFDLDHEWLEEENCTREPEFYTKTYMINIEGQDMETYQTFVVPQASVPSKKHKNDNDGASITPKKLILTQLTKKRNQGKMQLRKPTHLLIRKKEDRHSLQNIEITNIQRNSRYLQK